MRLLFLLLLTGCGNTIMIPKKVQVESTKPIKVKPVKVDVNVPNTTQTIVHTVDISASASMFRAECERDFVTEEDIQVCMNTKLTEFLVNIKALQDALNAQGGTL